MLMIDLYFKEAVTSTDHVVIVGMMNKVLIHQNTKTKNIIIFERNDNKLFVLKQISSEQNYDM